MWSYLFELSLCNQYCVRPVITLTTWLTNNWNYVVLWRKSTLMYTMATLIWNAECINMQKPLRWEDGELGCCHAVPKKLQVRLLLFDISLQPSLDSRVRAQCVIHDEVVQDPQPWRVLRQIVVILCCYFLHLDTNDKQSAAFRWHYISHSSLQFTQFMKHTSQI